MTKKLKNFLEEISPLKGIKNLILFLFVTIVFQFLLFATPMLAKEAVQEDKINLDSTDKIETINHLPKNPDKKFKVVQEFDSSVTAYNVGDVTQTNSSPCISANGENICKALEQGYKRCAANFVDLGTVLEIENYGKCLVTDRMNSRYYYRVDIAMKKDQLQQAKNFGRQRLNIKVLTR